MTGVVGTTIMRIQIVRGGYFMTEPATITETRTERIQAATPQGKGEERIRVRAYELYEKRNGNAGDAESDWYHAEAELKGDAAEPAK